MDAPAEKTTFEEEFDRLEGLIGQIRIGKESLGHVNLLAADVCEQQKENAKAIRAIVDKSSKSFSQEDALTPYLNLSNGILLMMTESMAKREKAALALEQSTLSEAKALVEAMQKTIQYIIKQKEVLREELSMWNDSIEKGRGQCLKTWVEAKELHEQLQDVTKSINDLMEEESKHDSDVKPNMRFFRLASVKTGDSVAEGSSKLKKKDKKRIKIQRLFNDKVKQLRDNFKQHEAITEEINFSRSAMFERHIADMFRKVETLERQRTRLTMAVFAKLKDLLNEDGKSMTETADLLDSLISNCERIGTSFSDAYFSEQSIFAKGSKMKSLSRIPDTLTTGLPCQSSSLKKDNLLFVELLEKKVSEVISFEDAQMDQRLKSVLEEQFESKNMSIVTVTKPQSRDERKSLIEVRVGDIVCITDASPVQLELEGKDYVKGYVVSTCPLGEVGYFTVGSYKETKLDANAHMGHVLSLPFGRRLFRKHLSTEHCEEQLDYIFEVEEYRRLVLKKKPSLFRKHSQKEDEELQDETTAKAKQIIHDFLYEESEREANVSMKERSAIIESAEAEVFTPDLFDGSMREVYNCLSNDSFRRFRKSALFSTLLDVMNYISSEYPSIKTKSDIEKTVKDMIQRRSFKDKSIGF